MSDFQQMARRLAPVLVAIDEERYWVSVRHPPSGPGDPPAEASVEFWFGPGFTNWYPEDDCIAIFVVTPGGPCDGELPPVLRRAGQDPVMRCLVYGISAEGEANAAIAMSVGEPLVELEVRGGRRLDAVRSKFGLPPGAPSPYDLQMTSNPGGPSLTCEPGATGGLV
jgi:hypothetical protein